MPAQSLNASRKAWLAMLTKLVEAFPPQQGTDTALESRMRTYLDSLAERWHPQVGVKAIKAGLLVWKFFPSIAEMEAQCQRFAPGSTLVDSKAYPLLNGPTPPRLSGPNRAAFASLGEAIKAGKTQEYLDGLKAKAQ